MIRPGEKLSFGFKIEIRHRNSSKVFFIEISRVLKLLVIDGITMTTMLFLIYGNSIAILEFRLKIITIVNAVMQF